MSAQRSKLSGGRLHFQHGPIDIVIGAEGRPEALAAAHEAAWTRFEIVLDELVGELKELRRPVLGECRLHGGIARRMWSACLPFRDEFVTSMAAVAGAVADELILKYEREGIDRSWVNNGGDIALYLSPGSSVRIGLFADLERLDARQVFTGVTTDGRFDVTHDMGVRGVATSGWRGRSHSLGIADSVTVLAATAVEADAAATMIANAVNVNDHRIVRRPACELKNDSDLGEIPVTVDVPPLGPGAVRQALEAGLERANELLENGLIRACILVCQGSVTSTAARVLTHPLSGIHGLGRPIAVADCTNQFGGSK